MNVADTLPWWAALPVAFLLILGGVITVTGAAGLLRLKNFYQRIHGPAITVTLGAGCFLIASMIYFTVLQSRLVIHELLISVFVLMTAPVVAIMIMRAAIYRDRRSKDLTKLAGEREEV
ncbi:MAG: monovalent cation/H(+) antiporter subunit G [Burkholderiales bacterium]|nr:monovalent cation/H(+) antiporter subunit G [Burkholderiales bacterium]